MFIIIYIYLYIYVAYVVILLSWDIVWYITTCLTKTVEWSIVVEFGKQIIYVCSEEISWFLEGYPLAIEHGHGWKSPTHCYVFLGNMSPKMAYIFRHMYIHITYDRCLYIFIPVKKKLMYMQYIHIQRRPPHAKPDFNWLSGPKNGTWKRTSVISCLRSLAPMWQLRCSTTQATFTNPSLLRATPLLRAMF